jgi:hypothetical protein
MRNYRLILILLLLVSATTLIQGETKAERYVSALKNQTVEESEKDVFPDLIFFASYLYQ